MIHPTEKQIAYILSSINHDSELKTLDTLEQLETKIRINLTSYQASSLIKDIYDGKYEHANTTLNNL